MGACLADYPKCCSLIHLLCLLQHWPQGKGSVAVLKQLGRWGFKSELNRFWASHKQWLQQWSPEQDHFDFMEQMLAWRFLDNADELLQASVSQ